MKKTVVTTYTFSKEEIRALLAEKLNIPVKDLDIKEDIQDVSDPEDIIANFCFVGIAASVTVTEK